MYTGVIHLPTAAHFGRGNATILIRNFGCTGVEETLQECRSSNYSISSYYSWGSHVNDRYAQLYCMMFHSSKINTDFIPIEGRWPVLSVRIPRL